MLGANFDIMNVLVGAYVLLCSCWWRQAVWSNYCVCNTNSVSVRALERRNITLRCFFYGLSVFSFISSLVVFVSELRPLLFVKRWVTIEGRSVERIYLRQRSSDGSVNKTISKPRLVYVLRRQYVYVEFSQSKNSA